MTSAPLSAAHRIPAAISDALPDPLPAITLTGISEQPEQAPTPPSPLFVARRHDSGDERAVALVVARVAVAVDEVVSRDEGALEVGMAEIDPGVEDGDDRLRPAGRQLPGIDRVGLGERPRAAPQRIVGGRRRLCARRALTGRFATGLAANFARFTAGGSLTLPATVAVTGWRPCDSPRVRGEACNGSGDNGCEAQQA